MSVGASAPIGPLYKFFGITTDAILAKAAEMLK
jgi:transketolase